MPIYEYQCKACGHRFERLQKMSDDPVRDCPECDRAEVRKLVSQSAFILKGSGWYKDHYGLKKSSGGASDGASASGGGAEAGGGAGAGADTGGGGASSDSGAASGTSGGASGGTSDGSSSSSSSSAS